MSKEEAMKYEIGRYSSDWRVLYEKMGETHNEKKTVEDLIKEKNPKLYEDVMSFVCDVETFKIIDNIFTMEIE